LALLLAGADLSRKARLSFDANLETPLQIAEFRYGPDFVSLLRIWNLLPPNWVQSRTGSQDHLKNNSDKQRGLGSLLTNESFADVSLITNTGDVLKAHKIILAWNSPVFRSMFQHADTKESQSNSVSIVDHDASHVKEMLSFMYTGETPNLSAKADALLVMAEQYDIQDLKTVCEEQLMSNLSVDNAADVLALAHIHRAAKLEKAARYLLQTFCSLKSFFIHRETNFCRIFIYKNAEAVLSTPAWKDNVANHRELVDALILEMASRLEATSFDMTTAFSM
jgi:hypothetical protein